MEFILNKTSVPSTVMQSNLELWLKDRLGLITGTRYYGILRSKTVEQKRIHAMKICGILKDEIPPEAMEQVQYGLDNEDKVRKQMEYQHNVKVHELGFVRKDPDSIFGCSVDGILEDGDIAEFKTTKKPFTQEYKSDYSEIQYTHMWQMTHNCACTGAKGCHYMSYHRNENTYYDRYVPFNQSMWDYISGKATIFYTEYIHPIYDLDTRTVRAFSLSRCMLVDNTKMPTPTFKRDSKENKEKCKDGKKEEKKEKNGNEGWTIAKGYKNF